MKPTDTELANFYNLTRQTVSKYRKSKDKHVQMMYFALKEYYEKITKSNTQPKNTAKTSK